MTIYFGHPFCLPAFSYTHNPDDQIILIWSEFMETLASPLLWTAFALSVFVALAIDFMA
jgi:hypothetical protein